MPSLPQEPGGPPVVPPSGPNTPAGTGTLAHQRPAGRGVAFALASAIMMGMTPVFGKQAIEAGLPPLTVVATRTLAATALLFLTLLLFRRRFLYLYPVGMAGCFLAGVLNGAGSLLYYSGLARLGAGLAQLLFSLYPVFVAVLLYLDGQRHTTLTIAGLALSLPAVYLLTVANTSQVDLRAATFLLGAGFLYALHIPINQRILYEAPAPTVALYTLVAMTAVVIPACLLWTPRLASFPVAAVSPLIGLTAVTFLSRLFLFAGVKRIGGLQASLLGLAELLVAVTMAHLWLRESLTASQWSGAALLVFALLLAGGDRSRRMPQRGRGWLHWLAPPPGDSVLRPPEPPLPGEETTRRTS